MRKGLLYVILALVALPVQAGLLSEEQASARATAFFAEDGTGNANRKAPRIAAPVRLLHTVPFDGTATPAVYVYQQERNESSRCVFIAASDRVTRVLGYTDTPVDISHNSQFIIHNSPAPLPPALELWLQAYADGIAELENDPSRQSVYEMDEDSIPPLLNHNGTEIIWGQSAPFNMLCPKLRDTTCLTGCVVTAIAQVMRYYRYPQRPTGRQSYYWKRNDSTLLSINYDSLPEYAWDLMLAKKISLNTYSKQKAVAQLMRDVGYAVKMNYGTTGSTSQASDMIAALPDFFGYSTFIRSFAMETMNPEDVNRFVYTSLQHKHPLIITGSKRNSSAHAFVCDGADGKGLFHINWGWNGSYNGFYDLTLLDPKGSGEGGSTAAGGYSVHRKIYYNIQPATDKDTLQRPAAIVIAADTMYGNKTSLNYLETLNVTLYHVWTAAESNWQGEYCMLLTQPGRSGQVPVGVKSGSVKPSYLYNPKLNIQYSDLTLYLSGPGVYFLTPAFRNDSQSPWTVLPILYGKQFIRLTYDKRGSIAIDYVNSTDPTDLCTPSRPNRIPYKVLHNGQIKIMHNGQYFNLNTIIP